MSGALAALKRLLAREAPAQKAAVEEALRRAAATGNEHSVIGAATNGPPGSITTSNQYDRVAPSMLDLSRARRSSDPAFDFHSHPADAAFSITPSASDFSYWGGNFAHRPGGNYNLKALIASPPFREFEGPKRRTGHMFFETDRPGRVFDSKAYDNARFELQRHANRGGFDDLPIGGYPFAELEDGAEYVEMMSPLALLHHYAKNKGLGRGQFRMPGAELDPYGELTDQSFMEGALGPMAEFLRSKQFSIGGLV